MKKYMALALVASCAAFSAPAQSAVITLDFEGIAPYPNDSNVIIDDYYNGGTSSIGTSGTNYGVQFTSNAVLLCLNTTGNACSNTSKGGLGIPTSQLGALYFPDASPTMNVAAGFDTGFAFAYSAPFSVGTSVSVFSGLNGTGSLLATVVLPGTLNGACDASIAAGATYCPFSNFSVGFAGIAQSVVFEGQSNSQVFDDFTFGSTSVGGAVPEPATWAMMIAGFGMIGFAARRLQSNQTTARYA